MTPKPKSVPSDMLASTALERINASNITTVFVVDDEKTRRHPASTRPLARQNRLITLSNSHSNALCERWQT